MFPNALNVDGGAGQNALSVNVVAPGIANDFKVLASSTPGAGEVVDVGTGLTVNFGGIVNVGLGTVGTNDSATLSATERPDTVQVNLSAAGTLDDPLVRLQDDLGRGLLTLTDVTGFPILHVDMLGGADTINVRTGSSQSRDLVVDGGLPDTGIAPGPDNGDMLVVTDGSGGAVVQSVSGTAPGSGLVSVSYRGGKTSHIDYVGVEDQVLDADHRFVQGLYRDILGRAGDNADVDFWIRLMHRNGSSAGLVAQAIERSPEAHTRIIKGWYTQFLGRDAAGGEEQFWVQALYQGITEEQALSTFLSSPEFVAHSSVVVGAPSTSNIHDGSIYFINALYETLLHRFAVADEVQSWLQALPALGLAGVAANFVTSAEYRGRTVDAYYADLLHRSSSPAPDELRYWLLSGLDLRQVRQWIESSTEFFINGLGSQSAI